MPPKPMMCKVFQNHLVTVEEEQEQEAVLRAKCGYKNFIQFKVQNFSKYTQGIKFEETEGIKVEMFDPPIVLPFSDAIVILCFTIPINDQLSYICVNLLQTELSEVEP